MCKSKELEKTNPEAYNLLYKLCIKFVQNLCQDPEGKKLFSKFGLEKGVETILHLLDKEKIYFVFDKEKNEIKMKVKK